MADQVISDFSNTVYVGVGPPAATIRVTVSDGDERPGFGVTGTGQTHPEVDLRASTERLLGILGCPGDLDIDAVISATNGPKGVPCYLMGSGARVLVFLMATAATSPAGERLAGASEAGKFIPFASAVGGSYVEATHNAIHEVMVAGLPMLVEDNTQDNTNDQVKEVIL